MARTREPQYERCLEISEQDGRTTLGLMSNQVWHDDPRRLAFVLARYKFVSKMLSGMGRVLEVGCADAFATRIVAQEVGSITAVDFDPIFIDDVKARMDPRWPIDAAFDAAYAIDVLEHIDADQEDTFLGNVVASLTEAGVLLIGIPSIQSQAYASPPSRAGHVNCKDAPGLRSTMSRHFRNVFIFSMNDEVVHTGYYPMAHYLFALGCFPQPAVATNR